MVHHGLLEAAGMLLMQTGMLSGPYLAASVPSDVFFFPVNIVLNPRSLQGAR